MIVNAAVCWYRLVPVALNRDTVTYSHYNLLSGSVQMLADKELQDILALTIDQQIIAMVMILIGNLIFGIRKIRQ